jgi:hypothetical protein
MSVLRNAAGSDFLDREATHPSRSRMLQDGWHRSGETVCVDSLFPNVIDRYPCRLEGFCGDAKSPVREVPLESHFRQVRFVDAEVAANSVYRKFHQETSFF